RARSSSRRPWWKLESGNGPTRVAGPAEPPPFPARCGTELVHASCLEAAPFGSSCRRASTVRGGRAKSRRSEMQELRPGYYGEFGGRFVAETLVPALEELERALESVVRTPAFQAEWRTWLAEYVGRPTPLYRADRLARALDPSGATIGELLLKREDLCHTGAHKINNALGQVLLAKKLGKSRIIAETGAGQHGVATATACAVLGLPCEVYMGEI